MNLKSISAIFTAIFLSIVLVSCSQTVKNINEQPVPGDLSASEVKQAIIEAGKKRGWVISSVSDTDLEGKLIYKSAFVTVDIPYSTSGYSIKYKNSQGLKYDQVDNTIRRGYNKWTSILNQQIQKQLLIEQAQNRNSQ